MASSNFARVLKSTDSYYRPRNPWHRKAQKTPGAEGADFTSFPRARLLHHPFTIETVPVSDHPCLHWLNLFGKFIVPTCSISTTNGHSIWLHPWGFKAPITYQLGCNGLHDLRHSLYLRPEPCWICSVSQSLLSCIYGSRILDFQRATALVS